MSGQKKDLRSRFSALEAENDPKNTFSGPFLSNWADPAIKKKKKNVLAPWIVEIMEMFLLGRSAQQIHTLWTKNLSMSRFWGGFLLFVKPAKAASTHEFKFRCSGKATGPKKAKKCQVSHLLGTTWPARQNGTGKAIVECLVLMPIRLLFSFVMPA